MADFTEIAGKEWEIIIKPPPDVSVGIKRHIGGGVFVGAWSPVEAVYWEGIQNRDNIHPDLLETLAICADTIKYYEKTEPVMYYGAVLA